MGRGGAGSGRGGIFFILPFSLCPRCPPTPLPRDPLCVLGTDGGEKAEQRKSQMTCAPWPAREGQAAGWDQGWRREETE